MKGFLFSYGDTPTVTRSGLLDKIDGLRLVINDVYSSADDLTTILKEAKIGFDKLPAIDATLRKTKHRFKSPSDFIGSIRDYIKEISKNLDDIEKVVKRVVPAMITDKALSEASIATSDLVDTTVDIVSYFSYLFNYIATRLTGNDIPKAMVKNVEDNLKTALTIYDKQHGKLNKVIDEIYKANKEIVDKNTLTNNFMSTSSTLRDIFVTNFIGNPIFHINKWLMERDLNRIDKLKAERELLKARLQELKVQNAGGQPSKELKETIRYYEDQIAEMDMEIEKLKQK